MSNLGWLPGDRRPRHHPPAVAVAVAQPLLDRFARPAPLMAGSEGVGDPLGVLPVLYHLLWRGELSVNLAVVLGEAGGARPHDPAR